MIVKCQYCEKEFKTSLAKTKAGRGKFCSRKCQGKWSSLNIQGEKSPNWKGGKVKRNCNFCGKEFETMPYKVKVGGGKFCSYECSYKSQKKKVKKVCLNCGKEFEVKSYIAKKGFGKFCSHKCHGKFIRENRHPGWKGGKVQSVCNFCGKKFYVKPSQIKHGGGKFCSLECCNKSYQKKIKRTCLTCGKKFEAIPSAIKKGSGKYCSLQCYSENNKGNKNYNWKGGEVKCICKICGKEFSRCLATIKHGGGKFCSNRCHGIWSYQHQLRKNTSIELKVAVFLKALNIPFQTQIAIGEIGIVDFLLPNKVVVEADGSYWHSLSKAKTRDAKKDFLLGFNGYQVIRLKEYDINNHPRKCKTILSKLK